MRTRQRCAPVNCSTDNGSTEPKLQALASLCRSLHLGCGRVGGIRMDVPAVVEGREPRSDRHGRDAEIRRAMPRSSRRDFIDPVHRIVVEPLLIRVLAHVPRQGIAAGEDRTRWGR